MNPARFADALRVNGAITASVERRALAWLATRLPPWIGSDHLTLLALLAMGSAGLSYWAAANIHPAALILGVVSLAVNWFGDSLDGTLARVRGQQRPRYGYYVDHVVDCIGAALLFGGLALSGYMSPLVALGVLAAYLLVSAEVYLATHALAVFRMSSFGVGPTELRLMLAAGTLALFANPTVPLFGARHLLFDVGGVAAITGLTATLLVSVARNGLVLYRAEPLPPQTREAACL
jgi:phosphatidylglycerophosphate synthase